jgi:DNA-binding NarL/FixJ family response regulator
MSPTRIVIVHDDPAFRRWLRKSLDGHAEFRVVGEVSSGAEAIEIVKKLALDVLLLDMKLQDMSGWEVLRGLRLDGQFKTLLVGANIQREDEIRAILSGASGIVRKYAALDTYLKSIRSVFHGQVWVKHNLTADLAAMLRSSRMPFSDPPVQIGLNARELEIIRMVSQGLENREISESLGISTMSVKHYLSRIFTKLSVRNRVELALFALRSGLVTAKSSGRSLTR